MLHPWPQEIVPELAEAEAHMSGQNIPARGQVSHQSMVEHTVSAVKCAPLDGFAHDLEDPTYKRHCPEPCTAHRI